MLHPTHELEYPANPARFSPAIRGLLVQGGGGGICRGLQRHEISRLPDVDGDKPKRKRFKRYPIGYFHIDIAEVQTAEGKLYLFVGIDRTGRFAFALLVKKAGKMAAAQFLCDLMRLSPTACTGC
ncbi:hypothetical protein SAMN05444959_1494 [Paracoccus seriniphilus]|uniref:Transposase n=1 Tax=Paracoccus seriniphilus TaxID=184748 RepID=A0A239Q318_9RHOB|nr:hypothetical protein SAMN05444959_1494 [Paracoccus seriniphilus]